MDGIISMARLKPRSGSKEFNILVGYQTKFDFEKKRNPYGQGFAAVIKVIKGIDLVMQIQQQKDKRASAN